MTALWTLTLLVSLACVAIAGEHAYRSGHTFDLTLVARLEAPPQAATGNAQWSGTEEYQSWQALGAEKNPDKLISLAEAFLLKYPNSPGKASALAGLMGAYFQLNQAPKAVDTAQKLLKVDPDNLDALALVSYVFPFTFDVKDPDATAKLSRADSDAHHGLEVLQKIQKPANVSQEKFDAAVKPKRAVFNSCIGFVALQLGKTDSKHYPDAIAALKAAGADNPSDVYNTYRLGLAYLYSTPADTNNAIWYIARAVSLAQAAKNPAGDDISKFLKRAYVNYHGTDTGLSDIMTQVASSPNPPDGFTIPKAEAPKETGDKMVDAFNTLTYPLKLGGETAQKQWDGIKGQPIALAGTVTSVEKATDPTPPNLYLLHIAILDSTKSAEGYDIELKDSTQPNVKNLEKGDLVTYKGTLDSYVATPNMILTLVGEVTSDLPDKPPVKTKPKPPAHAPVHRTTPPSN